MRIVPGAVRLSVSTVELGARLAQAIGQPFRELLVDDGEQIMFILRAAVLLSRCPGIGRICLA